MLIETLPRVYRLAGAAQNWHQGLMAPCLWGGPTAVASHRSAAVLWGLDGFREGPLEISSPKQKQFPGRFRLYRTEVDAALTTRKLGIPVTNAFRTVRDLVYVLDEVRGNQVVITVGRSPLRVKGDSTTPRRCVRLRTPGRPAAGPDRPRAPRHRRRRSRAYR